MWRSSCSAGARLRPPNPPIGPGVSQGVSQGSIGRDLRPKCHVESGASLETCPTRSTKTCINATGARCESASQAIGHVSTSQNRYGLDTKPNTSNIIHTPRMRLQSHPHALRLAGDLPKNPAWLDTDRWHHHRLQRGFAWGFAACVCRL